MRCVACPPETEHSAMFVPTLVGSRRVARLLRPLLLQATTPRVQGTALDGFTQRGLRQLNERGEEGKFRATSAAPSSA